ncbi:MAG: 4'-phosphopantetheinyl transferase superfamily protein [Candidatus Sericytochromatia bacterium]|nr:4'-phosphopantetheinyl transferase superfamily protein [Candidatus Sericytochromatia bacterium]
MKALPAAAERPCVWPLPLKQITTHARLMACCFNSQQPEAFDIPECRQHGLETWVPRRQAEYLAGRWCLQQLLTHAGLRVPVPRRSASGAPDWPAGWTGALTHTHLPDGTGLAVAALAPVTVLHAIGLDLEPLIADKTARRIQRSILHPDEQPQIQTAADITAVFSLKESIYKTLQTPLQRFIAFDEVSVSHLALPRIDFEPRGALAQDMPTTAPRHGQIHWLGSELCLSLYQWPVQPTESGV